MSENNINTKDFVIGTLVGSIVGASVALIFAPKSGKELRSDINQGATQVKGRAGVWVDVAQEKGSDWKDKAFTTTAEIKRRAMDTTSQLSKEVSQKTKDITKTVTEKLKQNDESNPADETEVVNETEDTKKETTKA